MSFRMADLMKLVVDSWRRVVLCLPKVYLLEVNPGPDFKQTGGRLRGVIEGLIEGMMDIALEGLHADGFTKVYEEQDGGRFATGMRLFRGEAQSRDAR
jgi:hypothetical protein